MTAHRILIVEDEPMIVMMVEDFLEELGWDVVGSAGGRKKPSQWRGTPKLTPHFST
jgi:DNA-binding response OmpR family regulator